METTAPASKTLTCIVVTPEKAVLEESADFIALPLFDGELGVMPLRAPLIGRLGFGELRLVKGGQTTRFFIDGGFAQVRDNVVSVLTSRAIRQEELNPNEAERALADAYKIATSVEAIDEQLKVQERARAQLRIAKKAN